MTEIVSPVLGAGSAVRWKTASAPSVTSPAASMLTVAFSMTVTEMSFREPVASLVPPFSKTPGPEVSRLVEGVS